MSSCMLHVTALLWDFGSLMTISRHKTERSFRRYLKLGPEQYAQRMFTTAFIHVSGGG
jgi:hypothetical protein